MAIAEREVELGSSMFEVTREPCKQTHRQRGKPALIGAAWRGDLQRTHESRFQPRTDPD